MDDLATRRELLSLAGVMGLTLSAPTDAASRVERKPFDPTDPEENVYAYAKMHGNLDGRVDYFLSVGFILGFMPGQLPAVLTGFQNIKANRIEPLESGGYVQNYSSFYIFTEPREPKLLEEWDNPYTGKVNRPFHYRSGPSKTYITRTGLKGTASGPDGPGRPNPLLFPWLQMGEQIILQSNSAFWFPSDLSPEEWPLESPGERMISGHIANRIGSLADLENRAQTSMHTLDFSNAQTNWLPWMLMGRLPGHIAYNVVGQNFSRLEDVPDTTIAMVNQVHPTFFDAPFDLPYTLQFREYKRLRKPQR